MESTRIKDESIEDKFVVLGFLLFIVTDIILLLMWGEKMKVFSHMDKAVLIILSYVVRIICPMELEPP